jgi:hypothetical protein
MAIALEPGEARGRQLTTMIYANTDSIEIIRQYDLATGEPSIPSPAMTQLDVLLKRIKNDRNALLNTNFGNFLNAQDEKILMKRDILLVMLRKVEDPVPRANKVNELDSTGTPLLYWAIDQNDEYLVGLLLESGADPDIKITSKKVFTVWDNVRSQEIFDLLQLHAFCRLRPDYCVAIRTKYG